MISGTAFWESILARANRCFATALSRYDFDASATILSSGLRDERSRAEIAKSALRTMSDENAIMGISRSHTRSHGRGIDVTGDDCRQVVFLVNQGVSMSISKMEFFGDENKI